MARGIIYECPPVEFRWFNNLNVRIKTRMRGFWKNETTHFWTLWMFFRREIAVNVDRRKNMFRKIDLCTYLCTKRSYKRFSSYLGIDREPADSTLDREREYGYDEHDFVHVDRACETYRLEGDWRRYCFRAEDGWCRAEDWARNVFSADTDCV